MAIQGSVNRAGSCTPDRPHQTDTAASPRKRGRQPAAVTQTAQQAWRSRRATQSCPMCFPTSEAGVPSVAITESWSSPPLAMQDSGKTENSTWNSQDKRPCSRTTSPCCGVKERRGLPHGPLSPMLNLCRSVKEAFQCITMRSLPQGGSKGPAKHNGHCSAAEHRFYEYLLLRRSQQPTWKPHRAIAGHNSWSGKKKPWQSYSSHVWRKRKLLPPGHICHSFSPLTEASLQPGSPPGQVASMAGGGGLSVEIWLQ